MTIPQHLRYTAEHEWLDVVDGIATVGITAFAAEALGDVVFVELPAAGTPLAQGEPCGELESTKSVSDLYAPADGEVMEINAAVVADPGLVNLQPFDQGWLFRMRVDDASDLLSSELYLELTAHG